LELNPVEATEGGTADHLFASVAPRALEKSAVVYHSRLEKFINSADPADDGGADNGGADDGVFVAPVACKSVRELGLVENCSLETIIY
jgi:hypothetical protein